MCTLYILLEHSLVVNTDIIHKYKNKPYDEVLGAAQLIKRVKACKSSGFDILGFWAWT